MFTTSTDYEIFVVISNLIKPLLALCACIQSKCLLAISHSIHLVSAHAFTTTLANLRAFMRRYLLPQ